MSKRVLSHVLGFPRLGQKRELKWALEKFWRGKLGEQELHEALAELRSRHWSLQKDAGMTLLTAGDAAYYDHVLELSEQLGVVPPRFAGVRGRLARCFAMARGTDGAPACAMRKWFNTNYHLIVPEFSTGMRFAYPSANGGGMPPGALAQTAEAVKFGLPVKTALTGPLTYLYLGALDGAGGFSEAKLALADALAESYAALAAGAAAAGAAWLQLDEPVLSLDMPRSWLAAMAKVYSRIDRADGPQLLLANSYGCAGERLSAAAGLTVAGIHVDAVYGGEDLERADRLFAGRVLSAGVIDGRNVWKANLPAIAERLGTLASRQGGLWVGSSCTMLHVPFSAAGEDELTQAGAQVSFATEKLGEIAALARFASGTPTSADERLFAAAPRDAPVRDLGWVDKELPADDLAPSDRALRPGWQGLRFPTTTIGSLPQTSRIRAARAKWRKGETDTAQYERDMREEIRICVAKQERLDLDILVHGECERNDMVEFFAHQLEGIAAPRNGWVQSYGSRATRPPIIHGPVRRTSPMTVKWSQFAASLTSRPVKGMLTGPVTILCWSFPRADVPRMRTVFEIADALREEVGDLHEAGLPVIQVDEPALREGLPLATTERPAYLAQAVAAFNRIAKGAAGAQIHTHMCYGEFADVAGAIAAMDADVISLETSRTDMSVLADLVDAGHAAGVGPGVYDVHSPEVPSTEAMIALLLKALEHVPAERLWINPDCGLKTRGWEETEAALRNMVDAARALRRMRS